MKITVDKDPITLKVFSCSRCGKDHYINFFEFENEGIEINGELQQYWGLCPDKGDPVFMHLKDD